MSTQTAQSITLPASPKDLSEFILKLLGKGRTISKKINRHFLIDAQGFYVLNNTICQRLAQNNSALSYFEASFDFSGGHTYKLRSIDDFIKHAFIQAEDCIQAQLEWVFLVEFSGKPSPEKQRILINFRTHSPKLNSYPTIEILIEHTDVTWGYDLLRHIENFILARVVPTSNWLDWLSRNEQTMRVWSPGLFAILTLTAASLYMHKVHKEVVNILESIKNLETLARIERKIELVMTYRDFNTFSAAVYFMLFSLIITLALTLLVKKLVETREPAAILLNDHVKRTYLSAKAAREWSAYVYLIALIGTLCIGVFQNAIYDFLKSLLAT